MKNQSNTVSLLNENVQFWPLYIAQLHAFSIIHFCKGDRSYAEQLRHRAYRLEIQLKGLVHATHGKNGIPARPVCI
jgi:hypothetical protein